MQRLAQRLYYLTETLLTRGPFYQLMLVAGVILALSVGGGVLVHLTNPHAYSNTPEAIWWAFLRLTDPGYLGDDQGLYPRLVSTFLTIAGYVVFLGALVALMTNWLDRMMNFLASGRSPIFEEGHVLIIGWNDRLHALIEEIVHTAQRAGEDGNRAIVVLCDPYEPSMVRELSQKLDPEVRKRCRLLVRSGDPLEVESLERVDFAYARSIIMVATSSADRSQRSLSDITQAKVLMSMKAHAPSPKRVPRVVVEVAFTGNKLLVESVGWGKSTEAVVADDIMGRLFCQAVRFPGISRVYHRMLTDTFSDSITLKGAQDLGVVGLTLREIVTSLKDGTPIGLLHQGEEQSDLELLKLDETIEENDRVVMITSREPRSAKEAPPPNWQLPLHPESRAEHRILVLGWSTDLQVFLDELSAYPGESYQVSLIWEHARPRERERLERLAENRSNLSLNFQQGALLDAAELARTDIREFDKILLLADQNQQPLVADAENVLRYVLLERHIASLQHKLDLVVELNDEDNRPLLKGTCPDILMTAEILSHLLAQVSTHRSLMWIYEELFTNGGTELRLRPLSTLPPEGASFAECQAACLAADAVALGFMRGHEVLLNPPADLVLKSGDQLILVEME
ncbi:MAG: hypothetical protein WC314_10110 [Vulcanimicrobiota bacterium]